ncbi:tetratricopeptide repeat protein [Criblamydia sequanensis]|uniref:TPR repeat-containing protein n=1 Tax=Candidatus Criblamydia sequanensis CRIB-18 TaxID=1437425 RepID=A0A090D035_9BACT|nr:hypothetical protein [Criblamydia sequanensis]CDR32903.1 hypothetical protein CSEC_0059 [Criblamydia sequanensis CRIB-18]
MHNQYDFKKTFITELNIQSPVVDTVGRSTVEPTARPTMETTHTYQRVLSESFTLQSQEEVELYYDLPSFMLTKAKRLFQEGKKKEALQILLKAQTNQTDSPEAILLTGIIAKEIQLEDKEADYCTLSKNALLAAASHPSTREEAYENLGFLYLQTNMADFAIEAFQHISSPKVSILLQIAGLQFSRNSFDESLKCYFRAYFHRDADKNERKEALEKLYFLSLKLEKIADAFTYGELLYPNDLPEAGFHVLDIIQFYCKEDTIKPLKACFNYLIRKRVQLLEPYRQVLRYLGRIERYKIVIELSKKMLDRLPFLDPTFAKYCLILAYYAEKNFNQCFEASRGLDYTKCESKEVLMAWGFSALKKAMPLEASIIFSKMLSRNLLNKQECLFIFDAFGSLGYSELALMMLNRSELFSDFEKKEYGGKFKYYNERLMSTVSEPTLSEKKFKDDEEEEEELEIGSIMPRSANLPFLSPQIPLNLSKEEEILEFKKSAGLLVKNLFFDPDLRSLLEETFKKYGIFGIPFPSEKSDEYLEKLYNFVMTNPQRKSESLYFSKLLISNFLPLSPQIGESFYSIYEKYPELIPIFKTSRFSVLVSRLEACHPIFPINELLDFVYYVTLRHIQFGTPFEDLLPPSIFYISLKITPKNVVFISPFAISIKESNIEIKKTALPDVCLGELHELLGINRKGLSCLLNFISQKKNQVFVRLQGVTLIEEVNDFTFKVEENSFNLVNAQAFSALNRTFAETSFLSFPKLPSLPPLLEQTFKSRPLFLKSNLRTGAANLFSILINQTDSLKSPFLLVLDENIKGAFLKELKKQAILHFLNTWSTLTDLNSYKINVFNSDYKSIRAFFKEELIEYKQSFQNINLTLEEKEQREAKFQELKDLIDLLSRVKIIIEERASNLNLFMFPTQLDEPIPTFTAFLKSFSPCPNDSTETKVIILGFNEWQVNKNNFHYPTLYLQEKTEFILEELFLIEKLTFREISWASPPIFRSFKSTFEEILNNVVDTVSNNYDLKITYSLLKVLFLMNETYLREKQKFTEESDGLKEIEYRDEEERVQVRFKNLLEQINQYFLKSEKPRIIFFEETIFILHSFIKEDAKQLILDLKKPNYALPSDFKGSGSKKRMHVGPIPNQTLSDTNYLENLSQKIATLSKKRKKDAPESKKISNKSLLGEIVIKPEDLFLIKEK